MRAGVVRPDVDASEVLLAVPLLLQPVRNRTLDVNRRFVRVYVDGLRSRSAEAGCRPTGDAPG